ncbi:hypothetical protein DM826_08555 [Halonotius aquaticus]|uniref:Cox cluster protein n=1 Tax=Halonotius aquaticus TaxID=2216978 RepID=A0A3A6PL08_9EURY|nr:hypothetical protein [Halonotius aquaticus]RJX42735.1 hypothetical protein DM826_08555 [Halonotius aquaticus]
MTIESDDRGAGRRILSLLGLGMIALGGVLGFVVGANGGGGIDAIEPFGLVTVPISPGAMTLYGMGVIAVAIGTLYALVSVASRYD